MTLTEIAEALIEGCRNGTEADNLGTLYAEDAVSVEPRDHGQGRVTEGLEGIRAKHEWFEGAFETQEQTVAGPFLHGDDRFAVIFHVTAKDRQSGEIMPVQEVAIYHVANGKITREEFFTAE